MENIQLQAILSNIDTRQNLSTLRQELKNPVKRPVLIKEIIPHADAFIHLLEHEDAKTRKNSALLMGDLSMPIFCNALYHGYINETQRFVRSAYLTALQSYDCSSFINELKDQITQLSNTSLTPENTKHIQEEIRALSKLIVQEEGFIPHTFTGFHMPLDCIMLTNKLCKELIEAAITSGKIVPFRAGVRVITDNLQELLNLRTYSELLFVVPGLSIADKDPVVAAKTIAKSSLLMLLHNIHAEKTPFYFRIELKSKQSLDIRSKYVKKLSSELELCTNRNLQNSTSNYEIELRLIENKTGHYNVLLKLFTLEDNRFTYRKEAVAASIRPVNAAQLVALAKDYMIENSRTLDPFCGVGTMLLERQMLVKGNTSYGIDFYAPAIEKAQINTDAAGQIVHYINRNFFDFKHEYLFDEIFTNMPYSTGHKSVDEIELLYKDFFSKAREVLTKKGTIIMYSHNPELVRELSYHYKYNILEALEFMPKESAWLFIIRFIH